MLANPPHYLLHVHSLYPLFNAPTTIVLGQRQPTPILISFQIGTRQINALILRWLNPQRAGRREASKFQVAIEKRIAQARLGKISFEIIYLLRTHSA